MERQDVEIIELFGKLDLSNANLLRSHVTFVATSETIKFVVIDLNKVSFIDSSGLGGLVFANRYLKTFGISFAVCNPSETVRLTFEMTDMAKVFQIFATRSQFYSSLANETESNSQDKSTN